MAAPGPARIELVRHAQSLGNVARDDAEAAGREAIDVGSRDMDVRLSPLGRRQAEALGEWLATRPADETPTVVYSSPYTRARETAQLALGACGGRAGELAIRLDERLRDRDLGALDGLTGRGIRARFPNEAQARAAVGKFYHRPPGGEAWTDVLLRLRSLLTSLRVEHAGERVLIFTHDVVVVLFRYLLEDLDEATALAISRDDPVANASVTTYDATGDGWRLVRYNHVCPVEEHGAPATVEPEESAEPERSAEAEESVDAR
jgi:broad specificity phosphatase PhoE